MKRSRLLIATGYLLALLLLLLPLLEPVVTLLPLRPAQVRWRLEAFGALSQALLLPLVGWVFAVGTAVLLEHRTVVRVLSGAALLAGFLLAALTGLFALDLVEYRASVGADLRDYYHAAGTIYIAAFILAIAFLFWVGVVAWRAAGWPRRAARRLH